MQALNASQVVAVWEQGRERHAIDRALLLFAAACPHLAPAQLADLPLGQRNEALLALRECTFGARMRTYADCPACGARMDTMLDTQRFLAAASGERDAQFETNGYRFRPPTSRDLSEVVSCEDPALATMRLLERCCVARPNGTSNAAMAALLDEVEVGLGALDPIADIELSLACKACTHAWTAPFDIATVLWDEVDAKARALLGEVHALASAYGWSEQEILGLGEARRAAYLAMVGAP
jgi:hypothetical protein